MTSPATSGSVANLVYTSHSSHFLCPDFSVTPEPQRLTVIFCKPSPICFIFKAQPGALFRIREHHLIVIVCQPFEHISGPSSKTVGDREKVFAGNMSGATRIPRG